ncbi:MAG: hypothetical protein ACI32H_01690 [Bacilli bacterium]
MKKIFIVVLTLFLFSKCYAIEYKYSEWSPIYPGEVKDKKFIFEEDRYLWYKEVEKDIKYLKLEDIKENMKVQYDDYKFIDYITPIVPKNYKERSITSSFDDYTFKDDDITSLDLDVIGDLNISKIELIKDNENISYDTTYKSLIDGNKYINFNNKIIKLYFKGFSNSIKVIIHYKSIEDVSALISYRSSDKYNVYQKKFIFNKCDECQMVLNVSDFKSYVNQYIEIYKVTDKVYKTYSLEREYTKEYYKYLDGYIKDEDTLKKYYRFLLNDYIIVDSKGNIVKDGNCYKETCYIKYLDYKEEIENPKTGDNIYKYLASTSILIVLLILILNKKSSFVESQH